MGGTLHARAARALLLVLGVLAAGLAVWAKQYWVPDPVVDGRRMSEWAISLIDERTNYHRPYAYAREHKRVFREHPDSAIPHLIAAVRYPTDMDRSRLKVASRLPVPLNRLVRPTGRKPFARWLGILALSDLAKSRPDPRIAAFFLVCVTDPRDVNLRKIAAYEAGPWLEPGRHLTAMRILEHGLKDNSAAVRRDACRRIAESAGRDDESFTSAALGLAPALEKLAESDPSSEVRQHARKALERMRGGFPHNRPLHPKASFRKL